MASERLRVGIIGIGTYAAWYHVPSLRATGRAEVVACARRNPQRLAMAQQGLQIEQAYTDWRQMLDEAPLDAVVVSTPHNAHVEPTLAALEKGLHVLVDKPMALTSHEAWTMAAAAKRTNRVLMVSCSRAAGKWQTVKRELQAGVVGHVHQINCAVSVYRRWFWAAEEVPADILALGRQLTGMPDEFFADWQGWHADPAQMGGGTFVDLGIYWLDLLPWLGDAPVERVVAFTKNAGLPVESFVNVQAQLTNEVLLSLTFADAVPQSIGSSDEHLMIVGEQGVLTTDAEGAFWLHRDNQRNRLEIDIPDTTLDAAFIETILDGKANLSPAHEGAYAVEFLEATYRSAAENRIVALETVSTRT